MLVAGPQVACDAKAKRPGIPSSLDFSKAVSCASTEKNEASKERQGVKRGRGHSGKEIKKEKKRARKSTYTHTEREREEEKRTAHKGPKTDTQGKREREREGQSLPMEFAHADTATSTIANAADTCAKRNQLRYCLS